MAPHHLRRGLGRLLRNVALPPLALATLALPAAAQSVVDVCAGPAVNIPVLQPIAQAVDTSVISGIVNPLLADLTGKINVNLTDALSGKPLSVSLVDQSGNLISTPSSGCSITTNGQGGIQVGGGRIDGLGGSTNPSASAGAASAIAVGNGASTAAGADNAIAFGTGASTTASGGTAFGAGAQANVPGGVALGQGSIASRTNASNEAFTGEALRTTLGTVSVGSAGNERQITNVAGGTQDTDAVNVRQLRAVEQGGVRYDVDASGRRQNTVTLAGGDPTAPVQIRNVAAGVQTTDAVNVGQLRAAQITNNQYTDQRFQEARQYTDQQVGSVRREARQAAALGLAASSIRYDDRPGKISLGGGIGTWRGETSTAVGLGYTLQNGIAKVNISAANAGSNWGVAGGLSVTLN